MSNFEEMVNGLDSSTKAEDYLNNFFTKNNYKNYQIDIEANKDQIKAIKIMFESKKKLIDRVTNAFDYDPFCLEALFTYLLISEDTFVQLRFNTYYNQAKHYADFDEYEKKCYIKILEFYVDFLLDIKNITYAIKIQRLIIKLTNNTSSEVINRLAFMYFLIEDADELYKLYANYDFDAYEYILLLVTELKHDNKLIAEQILLDMFDKVENSQYLDHIWDIDENNPKEKDFADCVNDAFECILSIPTFFSFVNEVREKYNK